MRFQFAVIACVGLLLTSTPAQVVSFPFLEDFESFGLGTPGTMRNGWIQASGDQFNWSVDRAGTSSDTGPSVDHTLGTASGIYLYAEASNPRVPGDEAFLLSPSLVTGSLAAPVVTFWYHMYGSDMGTLHLDVFSGGAWTDDVWFLSGQQQTASSDPWRFSGPVFLTAFASPLQLRFRAERGSNTKSDMAIDDIGVFDGDTEDIGVARVRSPVSTCLGANETVTVSITNSNLVSAASGFPISYTVAGPISSSPPPELVTASIPPGGTVDWSFAATADLSAPGSYDLTVTAAQPGDADPTNDSLLSRINVPSSALATFPYQEDFETFVVGTPGTLAGGWEQELDADDFDWTVDSGGTPSQSGPAVDHTLGTPAGIYLYTETSAPVQPFAEAHLLSPCLDTAALVSPVLRFWFHMYGGDMGGLHVDVASGGTWFEDLWVAERQEQASSLEPWMWSGPIDLGGLAPPLRVRFRGVNGGTFTSDMAIDDVWILDGTAPDVGIVSIDAPVSDCALGMETVTVTVANYSSVLQASSFPVSFTVTGPLAQSPPPEIFPLIIPPLSVASFAFAAPADLSAHGVHTIQATSSLAGDIDSRNDGATAVVSHLPAVLTFPFLEDFEGGDGGWVAEGAASSWQLGVPAGATIDGPALGGTNSWVTDLNGQHNPDENSHVVSPCFDLSSVADPWVALDVWWNAEREWDGAALQFSTDMGASWSTVGAAGDAGNWYTDDTLGGRPGGQRHGWSGRAATADGSGGWVRAAHELTGLSGVTSLRVRVAFGSDGSVNDEGFGFDNFWIGDGPPSVCAVVLCGDCNLDGVVSILDSLHAAQADVGIVTLGAVELSNCNVTGALQPDPAASVTVLDALTLAQVAAGLPITLACCS